MKAEEVAVERLFASGQQLRIPVWQRRYSWDASDWRELWDDLQRAAEPGAGHHFLGSFVLKALPWTGLPSEARHFWVVDGQQRLTTLTVLLAAIRDAIAAAFSDADDAREASEKLTKQLLVNSELAPGHTARLVLQAMDNSRLELIVDGALDRIGQTPVDSGYQFFSERLKALDAPGLQGLLAAILTRLDCVWVTLQDGDNAHRVFQTLNAGGKPLRQSDLVRNYFFLLLGDDGEDFYETRWRRLEQLFASTSLDDYFVAWSITQGHTGGKQSLFRYFQSDLSAKELDLEAVRAYGERLTTAARTFATLKGDRKADGPALEEALGDLRRWGTVPADGLCLFLLDAHEAGRITESDVVRGLGYVYSFMARRFLAGFEPNLHKSIFVRTTHRLLAREDLAGPDLVDYLRYVLSSGADVRTWPTDEMLQERIRSTPLYTRSRQRWATSALIVANREYVSMAGHVPKPPHDSYTVEHVMPQTLTPEWEADLKAWGVDDPLRLHQDRLHVLGNLTLTPVNSQLSNRRFGEKRLMLQDDWLRLNTEIGAVETWTETTINERSGSLLNRLLSGLSSPLSGQDLAASPYGEADDIAADTYTDLELADD